MNSKNKWTIGAVIALVIGFVTGYYSHSMKGEQSHSYDGLIAQQTLKNDTGAGLYFAVYGLDREAMNEEINYYVRIPEELPLPEKLAFLAERISRFHYNASPIEVLPLIEQDGKRIARINLRERPDRAFWSTSYFQGSTGGWATTVTLKESFLQPEYTGEWIDGVQFYYEGEPISRDWDHIGLGGIYFRDAQ